MRCGDSRLAGGLACAWTLVLCGCSGVQSTLAPAGRDAERAALLFWWMAGGALSVWVVMIGLAVYYGRRRTGATNRRRDTLLIVVGGAIVPTTILTILLAVGLAMIPPLVARAPEGSLQIAVVGEQWWWRVQYLRADGTTVAVANEIRLPVGDPVQFRLASDNVIHSFWVPSLGGKMDMIPGRITYLTLRPTAAGVFRGACAEYCGTSHALMGLYVEVLEADAFLRWLDHQASAARPPVDPLEVRGEEIFFANGCSACHAIRGTPARADIGPDLTHVGGRLSLASGVLGNDRDGFERWITAPDRIKPGVHMPSFGMLARADVRALAAYLEGLQ